MMSARLCAMECSAVARVVGLFCVLVSIHVAAAGEAVGQGVQYGTIRGVVMDQQDLPVPGVTVTATSPALQGPRDAVTDMEGAYTLTALPPGTYEVRFELSGFSTVSFPIDVALGLTTHPNVTLQAAGVREVVEVVAALPAPIATPAGGANFRKVEIDALATPRTLQGIAQLAPGLTERSPDTSQVVINGAFAFDNVFMVNGVDVNDNLFARPQNLVIEDAIEETQVLTSGISAEYGRFSGGVVNTITKSGGDLFSGSWRMNLLNPSWTEETPFEQSRRIENPDTLQNTHEATFGGPLLRSRLWFFAAGFYGAVSNTVNLPETGIQLISEETNKRGEIKLTGTIDTHTLQGGFLNNPRSKTNDSGVQPFVIDPRTEVTRSQPNHYYFTNYRGLFGTTLFEAQYSQRKFRFENAGEPPAGLVDSPIVSVTQCACIYNAPYFDSTDPEGRNNNQVTANAMRGWTGAGRHDTKVGYEFFRSQRTGGNSQSATSYVIYADFLQDAAGRPVADASGRLIPVFVPGESFIEYYPVTRGAVLNVDNHSFFVQDHWVLNGRLSADLGVRFEAVSATSTGDISSVNTGLRPVPRLGLSYDVSGNGAQVWHATYGQYSGRYNEAQIGANSPVGNPAYLPTYYLGPAGQGRGFAPGFTVANYPITPSNLAGPPEVPLANIFVDDDLTSPVTHEFSTSYGVTLHDSRGYAEASYVYRKTTNMIESFTTRADGATRVTLEGLDLGLVSNVVYRNTEEARRNYQALIFQSRYRVANRLNVNGNYTLQLRNHGNYEGESTNAPGATSLIGDYPEAISEDRHYPHGRLQSFQRHRLRLWTIYDLDMSAAGSVALSALWRVDSGLAYSLAARNQAPTPVQRVLIRDAGYPDLPGPAPIFYAERGSETFAGYGLLDTSIHYSVPVFKSLRPWLKFDVFNIFNNQKLIAWSTAITPDATSARDALGIPTAFTRAANFGTATGNTVTNLGTTVIPAYPQWSAGFNGGRTLRVAFGVRF